MPIATQNVTPYEIIAGPAYLWIGPEGEAFPALTDDPGVNWTYLGFTMNGVKASHPQTIKDIMVDQLIVPVKKIRPDEKFQVSTQLASLTLENYALVMNSVDVEDNVTWKQIPIYRGFVVRHLALLVRAPSGYMDGILQYQVPAVTQSGNPEMTFTRDNAAALSVVWDAIADPDVDPLTNPEDVFGSLLMQVS